MRGIVQGILLFLIPFALYFAWLFLMRRAGPDGEGDRVIAWRDAPWLVLTVAGVIVLAVGLLWFAEQRSMQPGERYVPARLEDGRVTDSDRRP
ncbi:DUF6111 family protein [Elioraea sp.]|jgi:hypothetical protein|uniref:DUF6111 family protein n=1 Tax=Elioraea sp. TaxID=2185103 RepID=UPI003F703A63